MSKHEAKFQVGQIIQHKMFDYIGVVFDVDPIFQGTDEWYEQETRFGELLSSVLLGFSHQHDGC